MPALYPDQVNLLAEAVLEARSCIEIETGECTEAMERLIARAVIEAYDGGDRGLQLLVAKGVLAAAHSETLSS
jgi:hypothetical protein